MAAAKRSATSRTGPRVQLFTRTHARSKKKKKCNGYRNRRALTTIGHPFHISHFQEEGTSLNSEQGVCASRVCVCVCGGCGGGGCLFYFPSMRPDGSQAGSRQAEASWRWFDGGGVASSDPTDCWFNNSCKHHSPGASVPFTEDNLNQAELS